MAEETTDPLAGQDGRRSGDGADSFSNILDAQFSNQTMDGRDAEPDLGEMLGHPAIEDEDESADETTTETLPEDTLPDEEVLPEESPQHRFQSHEEAERAHAEAERRMHESTQQASLLQRELDLLRREVDEIRRGRGEQATTEAPAVEPPQPTQPAFDVAKHWEDTYRRVEALDPDREDYEQQRVAILTQAQREMAEKTYADIEQRIQDATQRTRSEVTEEMRRAQEQDALQREAERKRDRILERASSAGLDVGLPTEDNPLGGLHLQELMIAVENGLYPRDASEDAAIEAVVGLVANRHGIKPPSEGDDRHAEVPEAVQPTESTRRAQARNTPLERSGQGRVASTPREMDTRPLTMEEMLQASMQTRKVG